MISLLLLSSDGLQYFLFGTSPLEARSNLSRGTAVYQVILGWIQLRLPTLPATRNP